MYIYFFFTLISSRPDVCPDISGTSAGCSSFTYSFLSFILCSLSLTLVLGVSHHSYHKHANYRSLRLMISRLYFPFPWLLSEARESQQLIGRFWFYHVIL